MMEQQQVRPILSMWIIILLISALIFAFLLFLGGNLSGNGYSFDQNEAFRLAQAAQAYRELKPTAANYGLASITIAYDNNTQKRFVPIDSKKQIEPFPGYGPFKTHSEVFAHGWVLGTLRMLRRQGAINSHVNTIAIIIFSQVRVCDACKLVMKTWLHEFQVQANTQNLTLSIWQLTNGYDPALERQGLPVNTPDDVKKVDIQFEFPSTP